jgi:hypothetical protein
MGPLKKRGNKKDREKKGGKKMATLECKLCFLPFDLSVHDPR